MDCTDARRAMLEADLGELDTAADSELGCHLATCERCRAAARAILEAESRLGSWLEARTPRLDAGPALAKAASAARRRDTMRRSGALALAAAAVLAGILLVPRRPEIPPSSGAPTAPAEPGHFSVTAPPGRDLVVLHTANPKIVVVWYLPTRRT